jgi:hypothetical protein
MNTTTDTTEKTLTFDIVRTKTGSKVHRSVVYQGRRGARAICGVRIAYSARLGGSGSLCEGCFNDATRAIAAAIVEGFTPEAK